MNKTILKTILVGVGLFLIAPIASAATLIFSPSTVNVTTGNSFNVQVSVDPVVKVGAVEVQLNYPADLLEVTSFTLDSNWMAAPDNSINNTTGVAIKSGGYPGGITTQKVFGTVSFRAKKAGSATVSLGAKSMALNASSANVLTLGSTIQATIKDAAAPVQQPQVTQPSTTGTQTPAPTTTVKPKTVAQQPTTQPQTGTEQPAEQPQVTAQANQPNTNQASLLSSIGSLLSLRTNNFLVGLIVVLVIVAIIIYAIKYFKPKKNGKPE